MKRLYLFLSSKIALLADLPPLIFRLILAYGFYGPALEKATHFDSTVQWFAQGLHLPFPEINAAMAVTTECLGTVLVFLGLATRIISIPMMVVMVVAIATVHWPDGFAACETVKNASGAIERVKHGFEIPMYYFFMLFSLVIGGPGRISLDYLLKKKLIGEETK
jgi:putative oxidoreductase